jgi:hypothetical protein
MVFEEFFADSGGSFESGGFYFGFGFGCSFCDVRRSGGAFLGASVLGFFGVETLGSCFDGGLCGRRYVFVVFRF